MMDFNVESWKTRLENFKLSFYNSVYIDENTKQELLLDLLQDLFSENLKEESRIEIVLFIEQNIDFLVLDTDGAEQVFGSLQNVFDSLGNHLVALKCQVLSSMSVVAVVFDFQETKVDLYQTLLNQLWDTIFKVNSGHPLLRKTCSQCLILFEENFKDGLVEHLSTLLATSKAERSFASYDHTLLLGCLVNHVSTSLNRYGNDNQIQSELNKCISFLIDQTRVLSITGLLLLLRKLLPCLEVGRVSRLLLNTIIQYSFQSWDVLLSYISVYIQMNYSNLLQSQYSDELIVTLLMKLLLSRNMDHNTIECISLIHHWMDAIFVNLPKSVYQNASYIVNTSLQPTIYDEMSKFPPTFQSLVAVSSYGNAEIPNEVQSSMLEMVLRHASTIRTNKDTVSFFLCLYNLYCNGSDKIKQRVTALVEEIAVINVRASSNVVDFCESIESHHQRECAQDLWKAIMKRLLLFSPREIASSLPFYLSYAQHVARVKDIWPMAFTTYKRRPKHVLKTSCVCWAIIQKLQEVVKSSLIGECSWEDGALLLSVCKEILLSNGDKAEIRYGIASILWEITQSFTDYNVCDKAMFYYLIIGNVSHKYFPSILVPHCKSNEKSLDNFQEVAKSISSGLPSVKETKADFLLFEMVEQSSDDYIERVISVLPGKSLAQSYYEAVSSDEKFDRSIHKKFSLTFKNNDTDEEKAEEEKLEFDEIYGLDIKLEPVESSANTCSILCPYLSRGNVNNDVGCLGKNMEVQFKLTEPCTVNYNTRIDFTDRNNDCWTCLCQSFQLSFGDIVQTLPKFSEKHNGGAITLFDELWDDITSDQRSVDNSSSNKALSIKALDPLKRENLTILLKPFLVGNESESDLKVGLYLPPKSTVLIKFEFSELRTLARLAVDDYTLLDALDLYLNTMMEKHFS